MLLEYVKKIINMKRWRMLNSHNMTTFRQIFGDMNKIHIGRYTYGEIYVSSPNTSNELFIGDFCSIAGNVKFLLGADHRLDIVSTYPFRTKLYNAGVDAISKGNIVIDDDVWIGENVVVLSNVHIGQGAVVSAGAVVTHDVPPYTIVGGVPAKVLKMRYESDIISYLVTLDYKAVLKKDIDKYLDTLFVKIEDYSLDELRKILDWFPKKLDD